MNLENDELEKFFEELNFKPITKGLGFHHSVKDKSEVRTSLKARSIDLKKDFAKKQIEIEKSKSNFNTQNKVNMGELAAFYNEPEIEEVTTLFVEASNDSTVELATVANRFGAWLVDLTLIFSMQIILIGTVVVTAKIPLDTFDSLVPANGTLESFSILTAMFYIFYFTFFDKTNFSTPGKNLLGLKLIAVTESEKVSILQSFSRSLISLISIPLLGLVSLLNLTDSWSDTKVCKK